jgi:ribosomal protein S18 acetylase RimI-like enzyme
LERPLVPGELTIQGGDVVAPAEYRSLLAAVGWPAPEQPDPVLRQALEVTWNVTARAEGGKLVGLARVLDDGALYASVWDVIVLPECQRRGIGRALMAHVLEVTSSRRLVSLISTRDGEALYRRSGFNERDARSTALFIRHEGRSDPLP